MRLGIDLFCGAAGGWSLGMAWAGVPVVGAVEIDDYRAAQYRDNFGITPMRDIRHVRGRDFAAHAWLMAGSPPCKGISEVNQKGKGVDDDGLFFEAIRVADEHRPDWVALENVSRLKSRGADRVAHGLEQAGYTCWPLVVGSGHAGAPHQRERVFIVAANTARRKGWLARQSWLPFVRYPAIGRLHQGPPPSLGGLWDIGPKDISRALRAYDGVPDDVAEQARHAFGDAVTPLIPWMITRALHAWDEGWPMTEAA